MSMTPGTRLGPYEIVAPLGSGGIGEVYKARDTRLDRIVAVKVLRAHLADNREWRQRFEREARAIATLTHPNICTLYDIGRQDDVEFLVMEYVAGETLATHLQRGPLPLDQLLPLASQIADALHRAHRAGIVHRDLKPANVMLTSAGAKLLDFGLAAIRPPGLAFAGVSSHAEEGQSPTRTVAQDPLTGEGTILGTLHYMAPEQLEGRPTDARTDIFALGALIYEMTTGRRAFDGDTPVTVISAILKDTPLPLRQVELRAPVALERLTHACLVKDPEHRFQSAHDVRMQLAWLQQDRLERSPEVVGGGRSNAAFARRWGLAAAVLAMLVWFGYASWFARDAAQPERTSPARALITPPETIQFHFVGDFGGPPAIAPDGSRMVFVGLDREGRRSLYLRRLDALDFSQLGGTDGATFPFWSPDSRSIGFFADGALKRIDASGGPAITIAAALNPRGGSWGSSGVIIFEPEARSEIFAVPASGGQPTPVTTVDRTKHTTHRWPRFLPDGRRFLFLAASHAAPDSEDVGIFVGSIDGTKTQLVVRSHANAVYANGYLIFVRKQTLLAQPFDLGTDTLSGEPLTVGDVQVDAGTWRAVFDASDTGLLQYQPIGKSVSGTRLEWWSRSGKLLSTLEQATNTKVLGVNLSPDGKALAAPLGDPRADIWIYDLVGSTRRRLTFGSPLFNAAVWSPDAKRVVFSADRQTGAFLNMHVKASTGVGTEELLLESQLTQVPTDWSPDGRFVAFNQYDPRATHRDIWMFQFATRKPFPFQQSSRGEFDAQFSPDGRWVAYTMDVEREEIYVVPFEDPAVGSGARTGGRWQVSTNGGSYARWRRDGLELFYLSADGHLMAAEIDGQTPSLEVKGVRQLFRVSATPLTINQGFPYDVTPDGQRFIVNTIAPQVSEPLVMVSNWTRLLSR
jgi:Tol biopolymer transport system component